MCDCGPSHGQDELNWQLCNPPRQRVWTTQLGNKMLMDQMNDGHLANCVMMLRRGLDRKMMHHLLVMPRPSGDHAQDALDYEMSCMLDRGDIDEQCEWAWGTIYRDLIDEIEDRIAEKYGFTVEHYLKQYAHNYRTYPV